MNARHSIQLQTLPGIGSLYPWARRGSAFSRYMLRRPHENDFHAFARFPERRGLVLDIGANAGMSALSLRAVGLRNPILSFEANPAHRADLQILRRFLPNFDFRLLAVGDAPGHFDLHIPMYRGVAMTGEASLDKGAIGRSQSLRIALGNKMEHDAFTIRTVPVEVVKLDDSDLEPDFIKIDVQGAELAAVRGMLSTIKRTRPIIMAESSSATLAASDLLQPFGYSAWAFDAQARSFVPYSGQASLNLFLIPEDDAPLR